jgi:hypothetical protein
MSNPQTLVYECSRANAQVKITNNEWINEFSEGIKLEKGDQVKLLGSFIQESGAGDQIEISQDEVATIGFTPYMKFESVKFTTPKTDGGESIQYQYRMGDIAEPVLWTDSLGVEPPYTQGANYPGADGGTEYNKIYVNAAGATAGGADAVNPVSGVPNTFSTSVYELQSWNTNIQKFKTTTNPNTAPGTGTYMGNYAQGEEAKLIGWTQDAADNLETKFNNISIPREFYISSLCKLIVSPVCDGIKFEVSGAWMNRMVETDNGNNTIEAGDLIGSYYMSGYNGYGGTPITTTTNTNDSTGYGFPRYGGGPQSVVGRVLAKKTGTIAWTNHTQTTGLSILDTEVQVPVEYYYVWDFVNPGAVKHENTDTSSVRQGATEFANGYNTYPTNNNLNGASYYPGFGYVNENTYMESISMVNQDFLAYEANMANDDITFPTSGGMIGGVSKYVNPFQSQRNITDLSGVPNTNNKQTLEGVSNSGLGFLWAGCGTSWGGQDGNPTAFNTPRKFIRSFTSWLSPESDGAGGVNYYWIPQPYYQDFSAGGGDPAGRLITFRELGIATWLNIAGIFKVNLADDNVAPFELDINYMPKFILPMTIQESISPYTTAYYGNNIGGQHNFAVRAPRRHQGLVDSPTNAVLPFAVGYNVVVGSGSDMTNNLLNNNAGNDALCSIHPQTPLTGGMNSSAAGIDNAQTSAMWNQDLIVVKKCKMEVKMRQGYYTPDELAQEINRQLHYSHDDYKKEVGGFTNIKYGEKALTSRPSVIRGNFIHTYLPDITYGFVPIVSDAQATATGVPINTNRIDLTYTDTNGVVQNVSDGNDIEIFQMPFNGTYNNDTGVIDPIANVENTLFKLIGGDLNLIYTTAQAASPSQPSFQTGAGGTTDDMTPTDNSTFIFSKKRRNMGFRCMKCWEFGNPTLTEGSGSTALNYSWFYNTRLASNKFSYGGSAKIWVGASDPTFSWDDDRQKFYFSFLYTPYRPAETENPNTNAPQNFTIGDAIPSAIINQTDTGEVCGSVSGVYIYDLSAPPITKENQTNGFLTLNFPQDSDFYSITNSTNQAYIDTGEILWTELGFDLELQLQQYRLGSISNEIYLFISRGMRYSQVLRNLPKLDIAINGTNPFKSFCSLVAPYNQFLTEIDSDEVLAFNLPNRSSSAFYLIGSDFPSKHYHGAKGTKLPIMGICGRNFSRFNFVFDLAESQIVWTIEEDVTITSIRTKILTNDYKPALNLNTASSVVYVLTKAGWAPPVDPNTLQAVAQEEIAEKEKALIPPPIGSFIYPPQLYHAPMFDDTDSD